jgi:hypothetical protein
VPRVFDNMQEHLLPALQKTLEHSERADFCVGYFNLRGWKHLGELIERWSGEDRSCCRLLVGMQSAPRDELVAAFSLSPDGNDIDNQRAHRLRQRMADDSPAIDRLAAYLGRPITTGLVEADRA